MMERETETGGAAMATTKRVFTLRLSDEVFDKIGKLASEEHRSMTNYIEFVLLNHIREKEQILENGKRRSEKHGFSFGDPRRENPAPP